MRFYILRHGKAEKESPTGADADRPLRKRGKRQARRLAGHIAENGPVPDRIISSPVLRARTTAEIIADPLDRSVEFAEELTSGASIHEFVSLLQRCDADETVMFVGHNPQLENAVVDLLPPSIEPDEGLRTGEAALLAVERDLLLDPWSSCALVERLRFDDE